MLLRLTGKGIRGRDWIKVEMNANMEDVAGIS